MESYSVEKSLKTGKDSAFANVNNLLTFPAPAIVNLLYNTKITSHQVIYLSLVIGLFSGFLFSRADYSSSVAGVILLIVKNVLDKVDGQLARARGTASRYGRFLDSISDFFVNIAVFAGLTWHAYELLPVRGTILLGIGSFFSGLLQCSYFVYYQVTYINIVKPLGLNRTDEAVTSEDRINLNKTRSGRRTLLLQRIYLIIYGWQDRLFSVIDQISFNLIRKRYPDDNLTELWYEDKRFLFFASFLGLGFQIGIISLFVLLKQIPTLFLFLCVISNIFLVLLILYRYFSVAALLRIKNKKKD